MPNKVRNIEVPNGSWIEFSIWQRLIFRGTKRSAYGLWATVDFFTANSALGCQSLDLQSKDNALFSGRWWKGNQPRVYQALPTCATAQSWGPDLRESLCKVADVRASLLTGSHSNQMSLLSILFWSSQCPHLCPHWKALASVAPSPLSWPFSDQDRWSRAILLLYIS